MTNQHGFELIREEHVDEIHSQVRLYKHIKSGAEFLSVLNNDENKVFGITFRTPPTSSNGIPHIMEHAVLGGSRKYPAQRAIHRIGKRVAKHLHQCLHLPRSHLLSGRQHQHAGLL